MTNQYNKTFCPLLIHLYWAIVVQTLSFKGPRNIIFNGFVISCTDSLISNPAAYDNFSLNVLRSDLVVTTDKRGKQQNIELCRSCHIFESVLL